MLVEKQGRRVILTSSFIKDVDKVREICADLQLETWIIFREPVEYLVYPLSYLRKRLFFIGRKEVLFEMAIACD